MYYSDRGVFMEMFYYWLFSFCITIFFYKGDTLLVLSNPARTRTCTSLGCHVTDYPSFFSFCKSSIHENSHTTRQLALCSDFTTQPPSHPATQSSSHRATEPPSHPATSHPAIQPPSHPITQPPTLVII